MQDVVLKRIGQPFYFSGYNTIPKGVTVSIEKGVQLFIDGNIFIQGKLTLQGEKDSTININKTITSSIQDRKMFTVMGGQFSSVFVNIKDVPSILEAYASSSVLFENVNIQNTGVLYGSAVISVFNNSSLDMKKVAIDGVVSSVGIEVFNASSISVTDSVFTNVGVRTSLSLYDAGVYQGKSPSSLSVRDSLFRGSLVEYISKDAGSAEPQGMKATENAIEIFNQAHAQIQLTTFENFSHSGLWALSGAYIEIDNSVFTKNKTGISSYNSNINISESEIVENIERGAVLYGTTVDAKDNWWGDKTGPRSLALNPSGVGDMYEGNPNISPWKDSKPKKKIPCCSNVLFIPGIQGSRVYKKELLGENQLWEPNNTADISKMYLTKDGYSMDKTLYFKDIIERTNIFFGGNDDIEIYRSFVKALDGLHINHSINDWQFVAYDWRMSPNTVVIEGTRYGQNGQNIQYKKMEDQIIKLADSSRTQKVTLIAHSYGGLITKRFLSYLADRGKIHLIDKIIFVAVPENGSPSSLFALLHGDDQDIGRGFIVNKATMRRFAQNMPALYALLPKVNRNLIYGIQATNTIAIAVPSIQSIQDMYSFMFKEISRPSTNDWFETNLPLIANKKVKQNIDIESSNSFIKQQTNSAYKDIQFYNISGIGLNTLKSIQYIKKPCRLYIQPFLMSPNCGLDHEPIYSLLGDGVVLADDLLLNSRWGEKYIFNMGEYNRNANKNYSHSNIISSSPIISTLMQIMLNNIGQYALPAYITKYGGSRLGGGDRIGEVNTTSETVTVPSLSILNPNDLYHKKYQVSASDAVLLSAKDEMGNVTGVNFSLMDTKKDALPIQNLSPNGSVSHLGNSYYINTDVLPKNISLRPDQEVFSNIRSISEASSEINIDFKIEEVSHLSSNTASSSISYLDVLPNKTVLASFENIPVTEYSTIEVRIDSPALPSLYPKVEMKVIDQYPGVYSNTFIYTSGGSTNTGSLSSGVGQALNTQGSGQVGHEGGSLDIVYLIGLIRTEIQKSGLRTNFKQRYILKLNTIEKNYKLNTKKKKRLARRYAQDTTISLFAIIKDLNRMRSLYYRGGMTKPEASFLYSQFLRLSRAFGD